MKSILFLLDERPDEALPFLVEGRHDPDRLALESGLWIASAGSAMLPVASFPLAPLSGWLWLCLQGGLCRVTGPDCDLVLKNRDCLLVPPRTEGLVIACTQEARAAWFNADGRLIGDFMREMGGTEARPTRQGALPSQLKLARHIVQATVRLGAAQEASSAQLQQLLWAMLASHAGQPVSMDAVLSHEIAKVIDAMRRNQFRQNFSLSDMAAISRMPVETFRKRFVAEVGMPPQSYQLFCKMERAKLLLKEGLGVRQAGIEVGMTDPYHFSKTFKNIVGVSPSVFMKAARDA